MRPEHAPLPEVSSELRADFFEYTPTPLPTMIGDYQLVARIGGGSMGDLYLAHKMSPYGFVHRAVIKRVKRSRSDYKGLQRMLLDEARATACFHHPNLVAIYDVGEYQDGIFLALEYVDGTDLRRVNTRLRTRKEALPFEVAVYIVGEVLRGLHHAHTVHDFEGQSLNIIHRDVNPANVLISYHGHVKLVDFGVVRMRGRIQEPTEPGLVKGKYAYLAPEYIAGEPCSIRTDIYAAGVMLFELLTGRECFTGDSAYEVMWKIVNRGVPLYRLEREGVPEDLIRIVERATHTVPERRYQTAQDLANVLETWLIRSRRHATPWVLSVFFTRHGLFPEPMDELRKGVVPLAFAEQALDRPRAESKPPDLIFEAPVDSREPRAVSFDATPAPRLEVEAAAHHAEAALGPDAAAHFPPLLDAFELPSSGAIGDEATLPEEPGSRVFFEEPVSYSGMQEAGVHEPGVHQAEAHQAEVHQAEVQKPKPQGSGMQDSALQATLPALHVPAHDAAYSGDGTATPSLRELAGAPTSPPILPNARDSAGPGLWTGALEQHPAVEVLAILKELEASGVLELRCGLIWKRVRIYRGLPMSITSNMGMELIGEHLVKARLLARRDLDRSLQASELESVPLTSKLIEFGLIAKSTLEEELGKNLAARLDEALEWRWGSFEFTTQPVQPPEILPKLDLAGLIEKARARRSKEPLPDEPPAEDDAGEPDAQNKLQKALEYAKSISDGTGRGRKDEVGSQPHRKE